jgi:hypothetical protein
MSRVLFALALLVQFGAVCAEDIITLSTRAGVTQSYLLASPESGKAQAVAVLFPGGAGKVDLERETARKGPGGNFLVRTRKLFADQGIAAAVMDAPSDQSSGMQDTFRLSEAHTEDIGKVVEDLKKRFPGLSVFLVGTSRGTISAAASGRRLGKSVDGVVLTSTLFLANRRQPGLGGFDFGTIPAPLLFVHHTEDACAVTPYSSAKSLSDRFPLISVSGGSAPQSDPCEAMSAHGYIGKEAETVQAIAQWILKQPYPKEIH